MKKYYSLKYIVTLSLIFFLPGGEAASQQKDNTQSLYKDVKFEMPVVAEPTMPSNDWNVVDFGAIPGGEISNTTAFSNAINAAAAKGGGRVIIPRGIWLTGPITLKSNINLYAAEGALVVFSRDFNEYPLVETSFEGLNTYRCMSPINGTDLQNVAITGKGIFDGSGDVWRPVKKSKLTSSQWKTLVASGGVLNEKKDIWYPSEKALRGVELSEMNVPTKLKTREEHESIKDFLRPVMVSLVRCREVLLDGPTFQNSPAWCIHPLMCRNVTLRNITVKNPWYSQNGDGLDLESCKNAVIYNCSFDVGDDAICIKSGKDEDGRRRGIPTENVIIRDCIVYHGHGGFTVGSEMSGGVRNIKISHCTFIGTDVGLRFKSTRGRGGVVENIFLSDINMINIPGEAILFDLYYSGNSPIPEGDEKVTDADKAKMASLVPPVTFETPSFRDIYISDVTCKGAGRAIFLQGLPEMNLKNIRLSNVMIEATEGLVGRDLNGVLLDRVEIRTDSGPAMQLKNVKNMKVTGFGFNPKNETVVTIEGVLTENVHLGNIAVKESQLTIGEEVNKNSVIRQ